MPTRFFLLTFGILIASQPAMAAVPSWQDYADCSTAYHVNSLDPNLNKSRSDSMRKMIGDQASDYRTAAIGSYAKTKKTSQEAAAQAVDSYLATNGKRMSAMMKAGKLEDFIDKCPQIPDSQ